MFRFFNRWLRIRFIKNKRIDLYGWYDFGRAQQNPEAPSFIKMVNEENMYKQHRAYKSAYRRGIKKGVKQFAP